MSPFLRILAAVVSLLFIWFVLRMIRKEKFLLKYAFAWLILGILGLFAAIFPQWVFAVSSLLHFEAPSNFLFFVCVVILMVVSLALCAIVSRQTKRITRLVQMLSISMSSCDGALVEGSGKTCVNEESGVSEELC